MSFLNGKTLFVTGGSRGIGLAIAKRAASEGANVTLAAKTAEPHPRLPGTVFSAANDVRKLGGQALPMVVDIRFEEQVEAAIKQTVDTFGGIDILINNAGMSPLYDNLTSVSEELFDKVIGVNLKGPFRLMALVGERMAAADGGAIINISSTASLNPSPDSEPYGAAKSGLNALTRSFAFAHGPKVRVNGIAAGPFLTDIAKAWDMPAFEKMAQSRLALQRGGQPQEIVGAALYLASEAAGFTTGTIIRVDGGTP